MAWHPAPSVHALHAEADARWPDRSRVSDGIVASSAHHQQNPTSDHEPDGRGIVHAIDLTHDPANGVDGNHLAELLRSRKDPRIRYVIWNGRLFRGPWSDGVLANKSKAWVWEPYRGANRHDHHMHVSVGYSAEGENDTSLWWGQLEHEEDDMPLTKGEIVWLRKLSIDGRKDARAALAALEGRLSARFAALEQRIEALQGGVEVDSPEAPEGS